METSPPRDTLADVVNLHEVAPEILDTLRPSALVEALRRRLADPHAPDPAGPAHAAPGSVEAGFDSAL